MGLVYTVWGGASAPRGRRPSLFTPAMEMRNRSQAPPDQHQQQYPTITAIMAPGQKTYPRATVKKIVKAHSGLNISKNADVLVRCLDPEPLYASTRLTGHCARSFSTTRFLCKRTATKPEPSDFAATTGADFFLEGL